MMKGVKFREAVFDLGLFLQTAEAAGTGEKTASGGRLHCRVNNGQTRRTGKSLSLTLSVFGNFQDDRLSRFVEAFEVYLCISFPAEAP
jgi:hypothetical protein